MPLYDIDKMSMKQAISGFLEDNFQDQMSILQNFTKVVFGNILKSQKEKKLPIVSTLDPMLSGFRDFIMVQSSSLYG